MSGFESLNNKCILITGGNKGLGKAIALAFAQCGAKVTITGRDVQAMEQSLTELQQINPKCYSIAIDVTNTQALAEVINEAIRQMGGLHVLVNNAGINIAKPALSVSEQDWDNVLDTNLKAAFFFAQSAARHMINNGGGRIINIASQMAFVGYRDRAAYCSSKGGMVQLTKALAVEWATYGINVNAVAPTFVSTDLTAGMFKDKEFEQDVMRRIPLGKLATAEDISGSVLFLASDMAAMITGETIRVDGGWTAI